jgi:predicted ArsR family transcriptional regulator
VQAVAALGDPARRALYAYVTNAGRPVTRDEAAAATGMKRATATFHLERMVADGLLAVEFARVSGRAGPGAGRTAKLYTRARRQIEVSLPPRQYELAAAIMAGALDEAQRHSVPAGQAIAEAATQEGRRLATAGSGPAVKEPAGAGRLAGVLAQAGYEPRTSSRGGVQLANCPFHGLVSRHPALVCEMNLCLLRGMIAGTGYPGQARLDPAPGRCCVVIDPPNGG